jgi:hypothetical protein
MKTTYYGDFVANGSTHNREPYIFTNLKKARKTMRSIATGNTFKGDIGRWWVFNSMENRQIDNPIAKGIVNPK